MSASGPGAAGDRVDPEGPGWSSLTSADLLVSLKVPHEWELSVADDGSFAVRGPASGEALRPTLTVQPGVPEQPGHDWFREFAAAVPETLAVATEGFELIGVDRYRLSSRRADVLVVAARRSGGEAPPTAQVQVFVWVDSYRMFVIGGSTPVAHEGRDLPVFEAMVRSLRVLPPRPAS